MDISILYDRYTVDILIPVCGACLQGLQTRLLPGSSSPRLLTAGINTDTLVCLVVSFPSLLEARF